MSSSVYPVHVDATLDTTHLSRWLWLVKWLLAIPHYIVLAFLWLAFFFLSVVAFFAILFTGRYPRAIFDFNVGVLRWGWRVAYYAYGALGTDRYPPFTLHEVPDYPAHLTVDYPEQLSRGLVLVKWWLLAIPHYLVVAFLAGSGLYVAWDVSAGDGTEWAWGGGLIGLLAIIAAVVLLFTGRYPEQIFDLVLGFNRWVLRVAAYAGLMTDEYPPFRLDQGGHDPGSGGVVASTNPSPPPTTEAASGSTSAAQAGSQSAAGPTSGVTFGTTAPAAAPASAPPSGGRGVTWGAGRVLTVVLASLVFLVAGGLLAGGTTLAVADQTVRDDQGFLMSPTETLSSDGYAIASEPLNFDSGAAGDYVPQSVLGTVTVRANATDGGSLFIGVAPTSAVNSYLADVEHSTLIDFQGDGDVTPVYRESVGGAPKVMPGEADFWTASTTGAGEQQLNWDPRSGDWSVVVMNAGGTSQVSAEVAVGATVPAFDGLVVGLLVAGGVLLLVSIGMVILALTVGRKSTGQPEHAG